MYKNLLLTLSITLLILILTPALIAETADIHEAAANEDTELVQEMLDDGVDPDLEDEEGRTPAMLAARDNASTSILEALYEEGADLDARDENEQAVIHYAATNPQLEITEFLIKHDVNLKEEDDPEAIGELITEEEKQSINDKNGKTPLMQAARYNENPQVLEALVDAGVNLEERDEEGRTAFHHAAVNPEKDMIEFLIETDIDTGAKDFEAYDALLYAVAYNPNLEVVELLLDLTVAYDLELASRAAVDLHEETTRLEKLIDYGVDITDTDRRLMTVTNVAVVQDNPEFLEILIEEGADLEAKTRRQETLLMHASTSSSNPEILEILKDHGLEIDAQNINDKTSLIFAARYNDSPEIINTLLDFSADPTIKDRDGMMALDYAEENPDLVETEAYERLIEETEAAKN